MRFFQKKISLSNINNFSKYLKPGKQFHDKNNPKLLLLFHSLWKVTTKYTALCLNALAKLQNARVASRHPALIDNYPTWVTFCGLSIHWMVCYQSVPAGVWGMRFCGQYRDASEKKVGVIYKQINVLKNIARKTKKVGDIQTD